MHDLAQPEFRKGSAGEASLSGHAEMHQAGKVFGVDHSDNMLGAERGIVDRNAGVLFLDDASIRILNQHVHAAGEGTLWRGVAVSRGQARC